MVAPDLFTFFGGSQYVDSSFLGLHSRFIVKELLPFIEHKYPVAKGAEHRGVFGRSSGGFGAIRLAMDYPGEFSAVAAHSADMAFDTTLKPSLIDLAEGLASSRGDVEEFLSKVRQAPKLSGRQFMFLCCLD